MLFSETLIMANAFAGETVYFGSEIGNGNGIVPRHRRFHRSGAR